MVLLAPLGLFLLAKLIDVLRDEFKLDLAQFDYSRVPWRAFGWVALTLLLLSALLSRGLFQEAKFGSVLGSVAGRLGGLNVRDWGLRGKRAGCDARPRGDRSVVRRADVFLEQVRLLQAIWMEHPEEHWHCGGALQLGGVPRGVSPKTLRTKKLRFQNGDMPGPLPPVLRLADGGVYNNLGNDWFEILKRQSGTSPPLLWRFGELDVEPSVIEPKNVIIVNAGAPSRRVRWLFPFTTLARTMSVLYDNTVSRE